MTDNLPNRPNSGRTFKQFEAYWGVDTRALVAVLFGFVCMYLPSYITLSKTVWVTDEQGHGPIILAVSFWLMWRRRTELVALDTKPATVAGSTLLILGAFMYVLGRTQQLDTFEIMSQILVLAGVLLVLKGTAALRLMAFPLFFMIFMIPLPGVFVQIVTVPLKMAVSYVAEAILYKMGYPIARTGVILSVGPYQLLVADACAGLNSMFTLEALGLLYLNLMRYESIWRKFTLAILIIPISFVANIIRVMILVLVTYHFGDAAGQGFVHGFAGMVLFMVALTLIIAIDGVLAMIFKERPIPAAVAVLKPRV